MTNDPRLCRHFQPDNEVGRCTWSIPVPAPKWATLLIDDTPEPIDPSESFMTVCEDCPTFQRKPLSDDDRPYNDPTSLFQCPNCQLAFEHCDYTNGMCPDCYESQKAAELIASVDSKQASIHAAAQRPREAVANAKGGAE